MQTRNKTRQPAGKLTNMTRLPTNGQILKQMNNLIKLHSGKQFNAISVILAKEIVTCWQNQDMPVQHYKSVNLKIKRLRSKKNKKKDFNENTLFDVLPLNPDFKCKEDKDYYELQKHGIGYCSSKLVSYQIHPSKVPRKDMKKKLPNFPVCDTSPCDDQSISQESDTSNFIKLPKERSSTYLAQKIREAANLSLSQTIKVLATLHEELELDILLPPTRSALLKACDKEKCADVEISTKNIIKFDGKTYSNLYGQKRHLFAICYNDNLIALRQIKDKSARTISTLILTVLNERNLKPEICVCDTEPTNTGKKNGVFALLKMKFPNIVLEPCRLHILDLIIKHEIQEYFPAINNSPNLSMPFVGELYSNWNQFKAKYDKQVAVIIPENYYTDLPKSEERRRDYRLLLDLVIALRYRRASGSYPKINLPNHPPSISLSRWNSRAIYCIFAELVNLDEAGLDKLNTFIINSWARAWFGVRSFISWNDILESAISRKSKNVISKNINITEGYNTQTNETAERVFRMVEEKISHCKSVVKLEKVMIKYFNDKTTRLN